MHCGTCIYILWFYKLHLVQCLADANKKQTGFKSLHREGSGQVAGYDNTVATTLCQTSVESVASVFSSAICDGESHLLYVVDD